MSNIISSAIFCVRNIDKAENQGKVGRWGVAAGQAKKVADYVSGIDNVVGRGTKSALNAFQTAAKSEKLFDIAGKAVNFASEHINPLICLSAGIDVMNSEDKGAALVTNATALSAMFAGESLMKKHLDDIPKMKCFKGITEKVMKFSKTSKHAGKLPSIIHGVAFVVGSCTAYSIGEKFGKLLLGQSDEAKQGA